VKAGRASNARLDVVEQMDDLRRRATTDTEAAKKLRNLANDGRLICGWETRDGSNVVPLRTRRSTAAGSRLQLLDRQIARATCAEEKAMFEHLVETLEREELAKPAKRRKAAA
jgi:hypothetical protein